jgi:hypothetical protein
VGTGRKLTQTGQLTMADARHLVGLLDVGDEIDPVVGERVFRSRSSADLPGPARLLGYAGDMDTYAHPVFTLLDKHRLPLPDELLNTACPGWSPPRHLVVHPLHGRLADGRENGPMRHETAIRRLRTIAARCEQAARLWEDEPFLVGAYAFGAVLDAPADVEVVQVAFVLDLPPDELAWCAQPQSCVGLPHLLEIDKAPVNWYWRPALRPVSNHLIERPLRIWSLDGPDTAELDALEHGDAEKLRLPAPADAEAREQLADELEASLAHLRRVEAGYWDRSWRNAHRGTGVFPENHLWDAVHGYLDLIEARRRLSDNAG